MSTKKVIIIGVLAVMLVGILAACVPASVVSAAALDDISRGPGGKGPGGTTPQGTGTCDGTCTYPNNTTSRGNRGGNGQGTGMYYYQPLSDAEKDGLTQAILEEYGVMNLYQSVIDQFGSVIPFSTIVQAEQQHVNVLVMQAEKYGVEVPANPGLTTSISFSTIEEACQVGVDAETADAALYDGLMAVTENASLLRVYSNLQSASLNSHLPAFEACR